MVLAEIHIKNKSKRWNTFIDDKIKFKANARKIKMCLKGVKKEVFKAEICKTIIIYESVMNS